METLFNYIAGKKWKLVVFLVFFASSIFGQTKVFTLNEAIYTALKNNRDIKIATMEIQKAEAAVDEAFGYALPSLDISANLTHFISKPKMPFPDFRAMLNNATYGILFDEKVIPFNKNKFEPIKTKLQAFAEANNYDATAQITQILFNSAVFRGIGASNIYLKLSKEQLKNTVAKTVLNVKKAFYGVLLTKNFLDIVNSRLKNAEENLKNIEAYHKQGMVSDYDELQVKVQVANIKPKVLELQDVLEKAKDGLKMLLGIDQLTPIDIKGKISYKPEIIINPDIFVKRASSFNFDLTTLRIKKQIAEAMIDIDRSDYWPTISAFGNYKFAGSSNRWKFQNYSSAMVGINFSLNLFKGGRVAHKVQQAKIATFQTQEQIQKFDEFIKAQVKEKINDLRRVQSQITALESTVKLAEKAYKIATVRYKEGTGTQLEIKNAGVELSIAKTNRIKAIHDYIIAKAELNKLVGKLNPKYLEFATK